MEVWAYVSRVKQSEKRGEQAEQSLISAERIVSGSSFMRVTHSVNVTAYVKIIYLQGPKREAGGLKMSEKKVVNRNVAIGIGGL